AMASDSLDIALAIAGPEPSAMSRLSDAIACCMRASPVKAIDSISRPCFANNPLRMPISSGTNENASGTALPTRSVSAPAAGDRRITPLVASKSAAAIEEPKRMCSPRALRQFPLEQPLGVRDEDLAAVAVRDLDPPHRLAQRRRRGEGRGGRGPPLVIDALDEAGAASGGDAAAQLSHD